MQKSICFQYKNCKWLLKINGSEKSKDKYGCALGQMRKTYNTIRKLPIECKARNYKYKKGVK